MNQTMQDKITAHYNHAKEKHPHFCDMITQLGKDDIPVIQAVIENRRWQIKTYPHDGNGELHVYPILQCEWLEFLEAYINGDKAAAIEECYDTIAVLMRIIDVLEGRQPLGNPEAKGETK